MKETLSSQRPLFLVGARRRNSTLYFTARTTPKTSLTVSTAATSETVKTSPKTSTRRPIRIRTTSVAYSSRANQVGGTATTARPSSARVTKYSRRKVNSGGTTKPVESQVSTIAAVPLRVNSRYKFVSRKPNILRTRPQKKANESLNLNHDQNIESSNQKSLEEEIRKGLETTDLTDVVNALQKIQKQPTPTQKPPEKTRTTVTYTTSFSQSSAKIKATTIKPTTKPVEKTFQEIINKENNFNAEPTPKVTFIETPTTKQIQISTFRGTVKPKLTFKQTPAYQDLLNSQEEEKESNRGTKSKSQRITGSSKQPVFKETTNFNFKESKPPISYRQNSNFNLKEPRPEYFINSASFSKSSTPKSNLIFNEVPIIIPVISSTYLKKGNSNSNGNYNLVYQNTNTKNNADYNLVYENTNHDHFKTFEDLSSLSLPPNHKDSYSDSNLRELSINIPIVAPSSTGYFRSTTPRTATSKNRLSTSAPFRGSTARPIKVVSRKETALPGVEDNEEHQITQAYVQNYALPEEKPSRSRIRYLSTTQAPLVIVTPTSRRDTLQRKKGRPMLQAFDKILQPAEANTYKPFVNYDYYDDLEASILGQVPDHGKVLLHENGEIECLDQGNFPHPLSCKKFIQCSRMENDKVYGWEYTCPKNLSFDPIGGMCNWSAGLGCAE